MVSVDLYMVMYNIYAYVFSVKQYATKTPSRFILDDSALYLTDKCESETVDLRRGTLTYLWCVGHSCESFLKCFLELISFFGLFVF